MTDQHASFRSASGPALSALWRCVAAAVFAIGLAAMGAAAIAAETDKPVQLKISLWVPPAHPLVASAKEWADSIEKDSHGTITAVIFPSEQLGKAFDHYDMARDGIVDVAYVSPGYQPGRFPIFNAAQLPFLVADARNGSAAVDAWYRKYAPTEMSDTHVCLSFVHDPGSLHSRTKVVLPQDLKGMKVRPAQVSVGEFVTLLGGTNVQASAPEARDVLERHVADAITFPWNSLFLFGIDKVVKYHIDAPLYTTGYVWTMNKAKYESMSPAQRQVIDNHCTTEWAVKLAGPWADYEAEGRAKMRALPDHDVYKLTPEQLAAWKKAAEPLRQNWEASVRKVGGNPDAIFADLKAELDKYKAGF